MDVSVLSSDGSASGQASLDDAIFGVRVNVPLMHQVVTAQLAAARAGTHSTKTRGEVRGGGKKPWRQKGTGRARHGSIREPQWVGGGIALGPRPRDHSVSLNKKMKVGGLRSALSARAAEGKVLVVEDPALQAPKTKDAIGLLKAWNLSDDRVLLVLSGSEDVVAYSFRNLPSVHVLSERELNAYDVLRADVLVFVRAALDAFQQRSGAKGKAEPAAVEPAPPAAATQEEVTASDT